MIHVFKKEVGSYFSTSFGFVFMGIFLLLSGLSFTVYNLVGSGGDLAGMFSLLSNMSFMVFPVLTMKLFAEERRCGTEELLLTSRLSVFDIVLGKYLAAVFVLVATLAVTGVYVGIIITYGFPNLGGIAASYLGYLILGMAMIAVCTFAASLADNQITAAIASFGVLFVLVMLASFSRSVQIPVIADVLQALAITTRYDEFTRGIFRAGPVCYYVAYIVVMLFLTVKNMERRRLR